MTGMRRMTRDEDNHDDDQNKQTMAVTMARKTMKMTPMRMTEIPVT